jgi:hypothetical protein
MKMEIRKYQKSWFLEQMLPSVWTLTQDLKLLYNDKTIPQYPGKIRG